MGKCTGSLFQVYSKNVEHKHHREFSDSGYDIHETCLHKRLLFVFFKFLRVIQGSSGGPATIVNSVL